MDYSKIGSFIMNKRKEKRLTQAKLAEKLFVSEKTVSKWENGKGLPDTNLLPKLCEILGVSLNDLLNGEMIATNNDNDNQLLLNLTKELEQKNKLIWQSMWVILLTNIIALCTTTIICSMLISEEIWQIITVVGFCILFLIPCFFALKLEVRVGSYKCKNCGCEIVPTYFEALWARHRGTTRHLKCPNCKKRTWCKKVINQ